MTSRQVRTIAAALLLGAASYTDAFEIANLTFDLHIKLFMLARTT